ncbi:MAG: phospho-sugar mutase [Clostridiaceae bacterium]|nr:phospho-sugar mutase [Clostridiaceae bacterium]
MESRKIYDFWMQSDYFDDATKSELDKIGDNPQEIEERFYKDLEFGTGGLRGIIGAGTNRINIYTIRKSSQGLANYLIKSIKDARGRGIAIAYDCRRMSPEFALEAAKVFAANGIVAYLFDELRPTPVLSYAVRYLKAAAGVVITASHNPKEYNGYKVYGEDGGQLPLEASEAVIEEINQISDITQIEPMEQSLAMEKGLIKKIGRGIDDAYISSLKTLVVNEDVVAGVADTMKIVYTPLHGSGNKPVRRILKEIGFKNVLVVPEQELPDSEFSTVKSPNPEEKDAFKLAIELAKREQVDLIIGTDPDSDRVGVVVKSSTGDYVVLTGNQIGCLLLEYMLSQKKAAGTLPANGFAVKTIVTSELARKIAEYYDIELIEVLTGFKFIGEKIKELDEEGTKKFLLGFEESYGYLAGTFARDKDAVVASMLIGEMAAYYRSRGMSLFEGLQEIFQKYGYFIEGITSFTLHGKEGLEKISSAMETLRSNKSEVFGACAVAALRDYGNRQTIRFPQRTIEALELPESNVLYYELTDGSWFCVRPSGTEPKIKIYYGVSEVSLEAAQGKLAKVEQSAVGEIRKLLEI